MDKRIEIIKKWVRMLNGNSVFHMRQSEGKYYSIGDVKGYYSDLRHKVTGDTLIDKNGIPFNISQVGATIYFAISIFQYGLGAYDLYLESKDEIYLKKFYCSVQWALKNQQNDGAWNAFGFDNSEHPYSSMAQSEGASLLCRAYRESGNKEYLDAAVKAVMYMLKPVSENGTALYDGELITLEESADSRTILNGMIFSIWGLYDVCLLYGDSVLEEKLSKTIGTLCIILQKYDRGYWSNYDLDGHITSPFYHDLHIEQLKVMYKLTGEKIFESILERWQRYQKSFWRSKLAFVVKAIQKLSTINSSSVVLVR